MTVKQMKVINKRPGVVFSEKEKQKENKELQSKYDKRINDMLHKIEFTNATPNEAYKMYMKLQGFLRKRRAIKPTSGNIYVPRTETGNYIIDGKVTKMKKEVAKQDPMMAEVMVKECVYRGYCPEMWSCGYDKTDKFKEEVEKYRNIKR